MKEHRLRTVLYVRPRGRQFFFYFANKLVVAICQLYISLFFHYGTVLSGWTVLSAFCMLIMWCYSHIHSIDSSNCLAFHPFTVPVNFVSFSGAIFYVKILSFSAEMLLWSHYCHIMVTLLKKNIWGMRPNLKGIPTVCFWACLLPSLKWEYTGARFTMLLNLKVRLFGQIHDIAACFRCGIKH